METGSPPNAGVARPVFTATITGGTGATRKTNSLRSALLRAVGASTVVGGGGYATPQKGPTSRKGLEILPMNKTSDNTQYGSAANGLTYDGHTVSNGWDCTVKRESKHTALVNVTSPDRQQDFLGELEVEADRDLQELAVETADHPEFSAGWLYSEDADEWESLANRWNAL